MRLLVDEDTASATLITRLLAAGHEVVQWPHGTPDEIVFNDAQRLALPSLTANVGRKGRRDSVRLYQLAIERAPHCGVIGIFRPAPTVPDVGLLPPHPRPPVRYGSPGVPPGVSPAGATVSAQDAALPAPGGY